MSSNYKYTPQRYILTSRTNVINTLLIALCISIAAITINAQDEPWKIKKISTESGLSELCGCDGGEVN